MIKMTMKILIDREARLIEVQNWGDYFLFNLESPEIAKVASPGQFVMIKVSETTTPLLRRPLSLHNVDGSRLEIFFQVSCQGTHLLSLKKPGDQLNLLGPLGHGFSLNPEFKNQEIFCVGGGRGIAPLYYLAGQLAKIGSRPVIFYGGRSSADLPLKAKLESSGWEVLLSTDDGSLGFKGLVTSLVEKELKLRKPAFLFACGPDPMMEKLTEICRMKNLAAEFSLEARMGCGFGACWGCVKKISKNNEERYLKVCQDGPVFSRDEIIWEESKNG